MQLLTFISDDGNRTIYNTGYMSGCKDSEFDQYGCMEAFDVYFKRQYELCNLTLVLGCLGEWKLEVIAKLTTFSCESISFILLYSSFTLLRVSSVAL